MVQLIMDAMNTLITNLGIIVQVATCGVLIWQLFVQRQHNRLSVTPSLDIWLTEKIDQHRYIIKLRNKGIGPARILSFIVYNGNDEITDKRDAVYRKLLKKFFPESKYKINRFTYLGDKHVMTANEKKVLVDFTFTENPPTREEFIDAYENKVRLVIEYESFYHEKLPPYDSRPPNK
jgi:hypothetical protein